MLLKKIFQSFLFISFLVSISYAGKISFTNRTIDLLIVEYNVAFEHVELNQATVADGQITLLPGQNIGIYTQQISASPFVVTVRQITKVLPSSDVISDAIITSPLGAALSVPKEIGNKISRFTGSRTISVLNHVLPSIMIDRWDATTRQCIEVDTNIEITNAGDDTYQFNLR